MKDAADDLENEICVYSGDNVIEHYAECSGKFFYRSGRRRF
jgi:hypothetical protein